MPKERPKVDAGRSSRGYVQINLRVPEELRREFKAAAVMDGREMGEIVEQMIREYLEKRSKRLATRREESP